MAMRQPVPQNPTPDQPSTLVPRGQAQANQLASTRGSTSDYMAARGAAPISGMGTSSPQPAPTFVNDTNNRTLTTPTQPATAGPVTPAQPPGWNNPQSANPGLSDATKAWQSNLMQMMNHPGVPDNIKAALQQAHDHFNNSGSAGMEPVQRGDMPVPPQGFSGRVPAAQPAFKGRTTSMQRRGVGVGQPAQAPKPTPVTPSSAAQDFLKKGLMVPPAQPQVTPQPVTTTGPVPVRTPVAAVTPPITAPVAKPMTV